MTTVAYRRDETGTVLASDRQSGWHRADVEKLLLLSDGSMLGFTGKLEECLLAAAWLEKQVVAQNDEHPKPKISNGFEAIRVWPNGMVCTYEEQLVLMPLREEIYAIGSGAQYAFGALAMGATPMEAVDVAHRFDECTGPARDMMIYDETGGGRPKVIRESGKDAAAGDA